MRRQCLDQSRTILAAAPLVAIIVLPATATSAKADPVTASGYSVKMLASAPAGASVPDSIATANNNIFVGFGNNGDPTGANGATSTIGEYSSSGQLLGQTTVAGHNDGLRLDPYTGQLWALQNEDVNPNLVVINPTNLAKSSAYSIPAQHGGGYDDVAFVNGQAFITASNPANNPNTKPALVSASIPSSGTTLNETPVLNGNASALNLDTGKTTTLNLQDSDGDVATPGGNVLFTSQADQQLVTVKNPGTSSQAATVLNMNQQVDDINFPGSATDALLYADKAANGIYEITGPFVPGGAYVSASGANGGDVSMIDLTNGTFTLIVTGINPGGMAFVSSAATTAVPEPGSLALLATGLLGLAALKRRGATAFSWRRLAGRAPPAAPGYPTSIAVSPFARTDSRSGRARATQPSVGG